MHMGQEYIPAGLDRANKRKFCTAGRIHVVTIGEAKIRGEKGLNRHLEPIPIVLLGGDAGDVRACPRTGDANQFQPHGLDAVNEKPLNGPAFAIGPAPNVLHIDAEGLSPKLKRSDFAGCLVPDLELLLTNRGRRQSNQKARRLCAAANSSIPFGDTSKATPVTGARHPSYRPASAGFSVAAGLPLALRLSEANGGRQERRVGRDGGQSFPHLYFQPR